MIPRERFRQDKPPYDVDEERYNRYKTENNAFNVVSKEDTGETEPFGFLEKLRERQAEIIQEDIEGYSRLDYALQKGAQAVNLLIGSYGQEAENSQFLKWNPLNTPDYMKESRVDLGSGELTRHVKDAAIRYGDDLVGCTELDKRWVFKENIYKPIVFKEADKPE
ncbi:MAG: reductive dehalogenase, partial [archaeon]